MSTTHHQQQQQQKSTLSEWRQYSAQFATLIEWSSEGGRKEICIKERELRKKIIKIFWKEKRKFFAARFLVEQFLFEQQIS